MLGFVTELPSAYSDIEPKRIYTRNIGGESQICYTDENRRVNFLREPDRFNKPLRCYEVSKMLQSRFYNLPGILALENDSIDTSFCQYRASETYNFEDKVYYLIEKGSDYGFHFYRSKVSNNVGRPLPSEEELETDYWEIVDSSLLTFDIPYYYITSDSFKRDYYYSNTKVYSAGDYCYWGILPKPGQISMYRSIKDNNTSGMGDPGYWGKDCLIDGLRFLGGYVNSGGIYPYDFDYDRGIPVCDPTSINPFQTALVSVHDYSVDEMYKKEMEEVYGYSEIPDAYVILNELESLYNSYFGSNMEVEMYDEISLCESYKKSIDLLYCLTATELIRCDSRKYTNLVSLKEWKNKISNQDGISCKVDMSVSYTKLGLVYSQDLVFTAFRITLDENNNYTFEDPDCIYSVGNDIEVEYIGDLITVRPKVDGISECIITNCIVTYGKF